MRDKMESSLQIAKVTFKEIMQDRVLYGALICGILLMAFSVLVSSLAVIKKDRVILDFGLMVVHFFCAFIAVFYSSHVLAKEKERKTIFLVLSRPVTKLQFLLGKVFGVTQVVFVNWLMFCLFYLMTLFAFGGGFSGVLIWALVLAFFQSILLACVAVFFASFSTATLSLMFSLGVYLLGSNISQIRFVAEKSESNFYHTLLDICSYIIPNMEFFQLGLNVSYGLPVSYLFGVVGIIYALCLSAVLLLFSSYFLMRQES